MGRFREKSLRETDEGVEEVSLGRAVGATCHVRVYASLPAHSPSIRLMASDCTRVRGLFIPRVQQRGELGSVDTGKSYLCQGIRAWAWVILFGWGWRGGGEAGAFKTCDWARAAETYRQPSSSDQVPEQLSREEPAQGLVELTALLRRRRRTALAGLSNSQVGLYSGGGGGGLDCGAGSAGEDSTGAALGARAA
eukprot:1537048-Pleurochrysis_carterae.AAC.1